MVQAVEEALDVHFQNPAPSHRHQPCTKLGQRYVRRPPRPVAVRTGKKVLLVHGLHDHRHRSLQHLVLEGRYPDGSPAPVALGHVGAAHWRRLVSARLEAIEKRAEVLLQPLLVLRAGPAIDARRAVLACAAESLAQKLHVDVMSQA